MTHPYMYFAHVHLSITILCPPSKYSPLCFMSLLYRHTYMKNMYMYERNIYVYKREISVFESDFLSTIILNSSHFFLKRT